MVENMHYVNLIILIALVEYIAIILIVGGTRRKYGVSAPATIGNDTWERLHRVQVNTTEQLVLFLPSIYFFANYASEFWAACLGSVCLVGRVVYFFGYRSAPKKRFIGAAMTTFPSYIMVAGSLVGILRSIT